MFENIDWDNFWDDAEYYQREYVEPPVTPEMLANVERRLGYKLPAAYVELARHQNGGAPRRGNHRTAERTSWAADHVAIAGIFGIGYDKPCSLCGSAGSAFWLSEWGYPDIGVYFADCPSAGHDMLCLDYRACGPHGEPSVVHVDQERDYRITFVAPTFEAFIQGLEGDDAFEDEASWPLAAHLGVGRLLEGERVATDDESLRFRYHPDPVTSGVFVPAEAPCPLCGIQREHEYVGPCYAAQEVAHLCPECIANGTAANRYGLEFVDPGGPEAGPDSRHLDELLHRTPGYFSAQGDPWPAHCGDYCALVGKVGRPEVEGLLGELEEDLQRIAQRLGIPQATVLEELAREHSPLWAHLFRCLGCSRHRLVADYE